MNNRLIRRLAVLGSAIVIAAPLLSTTPSAMADNLAVTTGTWSTTEPPGGGQPPPNFPDGGLWVSASTGNDVAVSAITFPAAGDSATVTLHVHQATPPVTSGVTSVTIGLCPTDPPTWKPPAASPGAMADAPKRNCDGGKEVDSKSIIDSSSAMFFRVELTPALISTDASGQKAFNFEIFIKSDQTSDGFTANGAPTPPPPNVDLQFEKVNPASDIFVVAGDSSDSSSSSADSGPIASSDTVAPSSGAPDTGASNSLSTSSVSGVGGAPLPAASFGDTTSTPSASAAPAPAAAAPQVALGNKPTESLPLQPAANKGPSDRDRILLGLLMLGLIGWTLVRDQLPSAQRRPSLYDLPAKPS